LCHLHKIFYLIARLGILSISIIMPIFAHNINYAKLFDLAYLPISAKHRLFIWHFVADKIYDNPILGYGFGASRNLPIENSESIYYSGFKFMPLPLHPHNNILHVLFETGIIGLGLFTYLVYIILKKIESSCIEPIKAIMYALFANYYFIGMVSFSVWQSWWVEVAIFAFIFNSYFSHLSKLDFKGKKS
jgi:O-antigen ligase